MAERAVRRREEETRTPVAIVPTRRMADERQAAELRSGLARVQLEIGSLQEYSRRVRVPTTGRTAAEIDSECQRLEQALERMRLSPVPIVGERFANELELIRQTIASARRAGREGRIGEATGLLQRAGAQISMVGSVYEIELGVIINGVPLNLRIEGVASENAFDAVLEGLEASIVDAGGPNARRAVLILDLGRLYSDRRNIQYYNIENAEVELERNNLLGLIAQRGREARSGAAYTDAQHGADQGMLRSFRSNIERIRTQADAHNIRAFTSWRDELAELAREEQNESARRRLETLRADVDSLVRRLQAGQEASLEDMRTLTTRYLLLTGRREPEAREEREDNLRRRATGIRGTSRTVRDGSAEWFAEAALSALNSGDSRMASLALSMALLERSAAGSGHGARDYLSSYWQVHDALRDRRRITPGMASSYASQIEMASLLSESDRTLREFASGGTQARRERLLSAARLVRSRLRAGNLEGARRISDMASVYADMLRSGAFRDWPGSPDMEAAIDSELAGQDGSSRFSRGLIFNRFSTESERFRTAIADWSAGPQKRAVQAGLEQVLSFAREGNAREAQRLFTLLVMYVDTVERLGRRDGAVRPLSSSDSSIVQGMERAIAAVGAGQALSGREEPETLFMESFTAAQRAYVNREADRYEALALRRPVGRDEVNAALAAARRRAASGDYRGAITLLNYVGEYYGFPSAEQIAEFRARDDGTREVVRPYRAARPEGWRYALVTARGADRVSGYMNGRREMLEAIRLETAADSERAHVSAAQLLDRGSRRIAQAEVLINDALALRQRFEGRAPFIEDHPSTAGRIPMGTRRADGTYPDYLQLSEVRGYEASHASDTVLGSGPRLVDLLAEVERAAAVGDFRAYEAARTAFDSRLQLVAQRTARSRTIESSVSQLEEVRRAIGEIRSMYGDNPPSQVLSRLDALESRRRALAGTLGGARTTAAEFPAEEYSRFLVDFDRERRLATAYSMVKTQLDMTETYRRLVVGQAQGPLMAFARDQLAASRPHLEAALTALAGGDMATAETEYRAGIYERRMGLGFFQAENALTLRRSESWTRGISEMGKFIYRGIVEGQSFEENAAQVGGPGAAPGQGAPQFEGYQNMHTDAFHDILYGRGTREETERINRYMGTTRLLELSIFGIPADNMSQALSDFVPDQQYMRDHLRDISAAVRSGDTARATALMNEMQARWTTMSERAESNQWWGNAATVVAALGISLIPGGGWIVGGAIFTTLAFERVVTEINLDGHASTEAWAMLALTVGTMGIGGLGAGLRMAGLSAEAAGNMTSAARLLTAARTVNYVNLGIGSFFAGYMGAAAYDAFRQGKTRDGVLLTGMALFPFAHFAGARIVQARGAARGRATSSAEIEQVVDELAPVRRPSVDIEVTETTQVREGARLRAPQRLFEFLRDYIGRDAAGRRAMLETIPENMRTGVSRLAENPAVRRAMESDGGGTNNELAMAALRRAIADFIPPPTSGGTPGTRVEAQTSSWLRDAEALRAFLGDLLAPDTAPQARLNARDVARARLEAIRAENPEIAQVIDGLTGNPTVRQAVLGGTDSPLSVRMFGRAQEQLARLVPDPVEAAEAQAAQAYSQQVAMAGGTRGPVILESVPVDSMQPRAMADHPGGTGGPREVVPGRAGAVGGEQGTGGRPAAGGRGGPRGTAPPRAEQPQAEAGRSPETMLGPGEVRQIGRLDIWGRRLAARWRQWRASRAEAPGTGAPRDFEAQARRGLEDTLASAAEPEAIPELIRGAQRGLGPEAAAEVATQIRSAPQRVGDIMKMLHQRATSRGTPRAQRELAWRALTRMYSHENVRSALEPLARSDPELASVLRQTDIAISQGARGGRISLENFRERLSRQEIPADELTLIMETVEGGVSQSLGPVRARLEAMQNTEFPRLSERVAQQRRAAEAATGRARERAQARLDALEDQLTNMFDQMQSLRRQLSEPANQPLARTEQLLGFRLTAQERAPMILRLHDAGIIPNDAVMAEITAAGRSAVRTLRGMSVSADPVLEAVRNGVERRVADRGSLDDSVLASLRSEEVARAVGRRHGAGTERLFRDAVREGTLDDVLGALNQRLPTDAAEPLAGFIGNARANLAQDFAVMSALNERATSIIGGAMDSAGLFGAQARTVRGAAADWWGQSWARSVLRFMFYDVPVRGQYRFLQSGREALRASPPQTHLTMARLGGYGRIALQAGIWGAEAYLLYSYAWPRMYNSLTGAETIEAGRAEVRNRWGVDISEQNARFVRDQQSGRDFFLYLPNLFPTQELRRPRNAQELRAVLDRQEILIDPSKLDDALTDGRGMAQRLPDINRLLGERSNPERRRELEGILQGMGITLESVEQLIGRERKTRLDMTDMADLRMDDWVRRGIAVRFRDVVAETFLLDCGLQAQRGQGASAFLSGNTDVFVFIWSSVQSGNIPINYVDEALAALQRQGVLSGIRSRAGGTVTLDSQLREALMREHLYLEVPAARGAVEGVRQNSFLGILDVRASQDPAFRPAFETLLSTYRENQAALQAFNRFNITEGANGEDIYGDVTALARLIVENPDTALARAREQGFVGPRMLGELDPSLRNAGGEALVRFVREHSTEQAGLRTWVETRRQQITNLAQIIRFLSENPQTAAMSPASLQAYADQQIETFRRRGWWRGPTPQERQAAEEAARRRAGTPTGGAPGQRQPTREEQIREERRQRSPRRPGFEMAPQDRPQEAPQPAAPAQQIIPTMTPEATTFYNDEQRSAGLGLALEGLLLRMYNDTRGDGAVLRRLFGEPTTDAQGQIVLPAAAVSEIKAEVYRLVTSTNQADVAIRGAWGITVTGAGPALSVQLNIRTARDALQNYIRQYANRRLAAQPGP